MAVDRPVRVPVEPIAGIVAAGIVDERPQTSEPPFLGKQYHNRNMKVAQC